MSRLRAQCVTWFPLSFPSSPSPSQRIGEEKSWKGKGETNALAVGRRLVPFRCQSNSPQMKGMCFGIRRSVAPQVVRGGSLFGICGHYPFITLFKWPQIPLIPLPGPRLLPAIAGAWIKEKESSINGGRDYDQGKESSDLGIPKHPKVLER